MFSSVQGLSLDFRSQALGFEINSFGCFAHGAMASLHLGALGESVTESYCQDKKIQHASRVTLKGLPLRRAYAENRSYRRTAHGCRISF